jgi:hypothetical protein
LEKLRQFIISLGQETRNLSTVSRTFLSITFRESVEETLLLDSTQFRELTAMCEQHVKLLSYFVRCMRHCLASFVATFCPIANYSAAEYNPLCFAAQPSSLTALRCDELR